MGFIEGDPVRLTLDGVSLSLHLKGGEQVMVTDELIEVYRVAMSKARAKGVESTKERRRAGLEAVFTYVRRELTCTAMAHGPESPLRAGMDVVQRAEPFMRQCGPCDYGLSMGCSCPEGDFRPIVVDLVAEVERLRRLVQGQ